MAGYVLVLAGIELIFPPVAAVFWIQYEKNTDNTEGFGFLLRNQGLFSFCHI